MKVTPRIKYFRQDGSLSYFVFDPKTREAICIDPVWEELEFYREYLVDHKLRLVGVVDTHIHADHFSSSHVLRAEYGAEIIMSHVTQCQRPTRRVKDGDFFEFGGFKAEFILTPGHTPDSLCVRVGDTLFTGDLLFLGSTGRTDFPGSDPRQSHASLQKILKLPPETIVFPGHDYQQMLFSTLAVERKENRDLSLSEAEYVKLKKEETMMTAPVDTLGAIIQFNLKSNPSEIPAAGSGIGTQCGVVPKDLPAIASIAIEKYATKVKEQSKDVAYVDVREPDEWSEGHMVGTRSIPLAELGFHLDELKKFSRVYLSCLSGGRSGIGTRTLERLGLRDVVNVSGGFKAWENAGYPIQTESPEKSK